MITNHFTNHLLWFQSKKSTESQLDFMSSLLECIFEIMIGRLLDASIYCPSANLQAGGVWAFTHWVYTSQPSPANVIFTTRSRNPFGARKMVVTRHWNALEALRIDQLVLHWLILWYGDFYGLSLHRCVAVRVSFREHQVCQLRQQVQASHGLKCMSMRALWLFFLENELIIVSFY